MSTLVIGVNRNNYWARGLITPNSFCPTKLKLPNIKTFKAAMLVDSQEDKDAFLRCLTENWVETLTELDLTASIIDISRFDARYDIFEFPDSKVPKLKRHRLGFSVSKLS